MKNIFESKYNTKKTMCVLPVFFLLSTFSFPEKKKPPLENNRDIFKYITQKINRVKANYHDKYLSRWSFYYLENKYSTPYLLVEKEREMETI